MYLEDVEKIRDNQKGMFDHEDFSNNGFKSTSSINKYNFKKQNQYYNKIISYSLVNPNLFLTYHDDDQCISIFEDKKLKYYLIINFYKTPIKCKIDFKDDGYNKIKGFKGLNKRCFHLLDDTFEDFYTSNYELIKKSGLVKFDNQEFTLKTKS